MNEPTLAGVVFHGQRAAMRDLLGDVGYERALARLSDADREVVVGANALDRIPFRVIEAFIVAGAEEVNRLPESFQREVLAGAMRRTLGGVWRVIFRFTSAEAVLARVGTIFRRAYDRGELTVTSFVKGTAEFALTGRPDATDFMLRGIAYGLELTLEHVGRPAARAEWRRTPDGAVFFVKWRAGY